LTLIALATVACLLAAAPASAGQSPVTRDCNSHGRLTRHYSTAQLHTALSTMPADVKEYTDCYDVINRALLAQIASPHDGGGGDASQKSGGSFLPTPLVVILGLLGLAAAGFGAVAIRRRWSGGTSTGS
jgi:hypothetical protein